MTDNMNDRELLELAAKSYLDKSWHGNEAYMRGFMSTWNPLDDDGDALRLAIKLGIGVRHNPRTDFNINPSIVRVFTGFFDITEYVSQHADACAATRRAIVRAAAEIGRQM